MLDEIYSWDESLTQDDYYAALYHLLSDAYPYLSDRALENLMVQLVARMPDHLADSIWDTVANIGKNVANGALKVVVQNPELVKTAATIAGGAVGGPVGASLGNMAGGLVNSQLSKTIPPTVSSPPPRTPTLVPPQPAAGKVLTLMQNPQMQGAMARAALGIGQGATPLTQNGQTTMMPTAIYLRALLDTSSVGQQ
jgi:hypothetical protein